MTLRKKTSANTVTENVSCPPPTIEPPSSEKLDFRDPDDDAWYTISIRLENAGDILEGVDEGLHLRLMFIDFTDMEDKRYGLENFEDVNDLDEFAKRFRVVWPQLQDSECWKVVEGLEVCSSYQFEKEVFLKFYNAIVKSVKKCKHEFVDGEENCQCLFDLQWQHGPKQGGITTSRTIDCICYNQDLQPEIINSELAFFICVISEKLKLQSSLHEQDSITIDNKNTLLGAFQQRHQTSNGIMCDEDEDVDLGGGEIQQPWSHSISTLDPSSTEKFFYVYVENLEIDILPENIVDFLYKHTSVLSQAVVFPLYCTTFFTRVVISTITMDEIMKIIKFIHNPSHIIVSTRGRPWVTLEKRWHYGSLGGLLSNVMVNVGNSVSKLGNPSMTKTNLFSKGTVEFDRGILQRDLFLEFHNHLRGLSERFAFNDRQIFMKFKEI